MAYKSILEMDTDGGDDSDDDDLYSLKIKNSHLR